MTLRTIIVPAGRVSKAKDVGKALGQSYDGMYTTPCSPTGLPPATHFISSGIIDVEIALLLPEAAQLHQKATENAKAQNIPFTVTQLETQGVVDNTDVSEEPPFVALERMGLKLINEE